MPRAKSRKKKCKTWFLVLFPATFTPSQLQLEVYLLNWWRFLTLRSYYFLPFKSILMLYLLHLALPYLRDFVMRIIIIIPNIIGISWEHSSNVLGMYLYIRLKLENNLWNVYFFCLFHSSETFLISHLQYVMAVKNSNKLNKLLVTTA